MPRFFVRRDQIDGDIVTVTGDDAHHISRALRMAAGEHITVCDMQKFEYECVLTEFLPDCVRARILETSQADTEPPYHVHLYQALPKGDKLDSIIQKAVECGVAEITTFESERCVARVKDGGEQKKLERRQRIALEAAKQSGRGVVPSVHATVSFEAAIEAAKQAELALFCYEGEGTRPLPEWITQWKKTHTNKVPTVSVVIGSEGGFSLREAATAVENGLLPTGLGKRILRTETASGFVLACLVYALEMS
ncbi:MAG: 16S rRNA (uracil(1498)-N(3))-methyltransferase [Clostridia bacterium]|nr:16S rRNA (uracil(1498)-N(3))-methyltransferase [Clostridia bacterium]